MKRKKNSLCFFRNMHVASKFTLIYFIIVTLPIVFTGIYISSSTAQSIRHQSELLGKQSLLQNREVIHQKIESIEITSISIAYNNQILKYLEDPFENNYEEYEYYIYSYAPLFQNYILQNRHIYDNMLYIRNQSFPDEWNGIYHIDAIENEECYMSLIADDNLLKKWRLLHDSRTIKVKSDIAREKVFSLCQKMISFNDKSCIGILELEVSEKTLFENLEKDMDENEYYLVFDDQGNIVSQRIYNLLPEMMKSNLVPVLSMEEQNGVITFENEQFVLNSLPMDKIGCRLVGIIPLKNFLQDTPDYKMIIPCVIIIALILFGITIYIVTARLTRRLKLLVKGLKSVQEENINIKMPVSSHDEFGELAESFNHMTDRIHDLVERVYKAQIMEKESELKAMEAQINPHFLYNTLSTISWMARKVKAENIDNLSIQISQFYRLVLSKGNSFITVEGEINLLKAYVEIEKIRFDNMFHVEYDLDEGAFSYKMIKIVLQPIAENAINHGILPKGDSGIITLRLRQDEENLYFTVIDDGVGMDRETLENINNGRLIKKRESGYAIQNIMERLRSVYGEKGGISIESDPGFGCTVNIVIPKSPMFPII